MNQSSAVIVEKHPVRAWSGVPVLLLVLAGAFLLHIAVGASRWARRARGRGGGLASELKGVVRPPRPQAIVAADRQRKAPRKRHGLGPKGVDDDRLRLCLVRRAYGATKLSPSVGAEAGDFSCARDDTRAARSPSTHRSHARRVRDPDHRARRRLVFGRWARVARAPAELPGRIGTPAPNRAVPKHGAGVSSAARGDSGDTRIRGALDREVVGQRRQRGGILAGVASSVEHVARRVSLLHGFGVTSIGLRRVGGRLVRGGRTREERDAEEPPSVRRDDTQRTASRYHGVGPFSANPSPTIHMSVEFPWRP